MVKGHKVGLTSAAMQEALGVSEPDYGHLLDDFFHLEHLPIPASARLPFAVLIWARAPRRARGVPAATALALQPTTALAGAPPLRCRCQGRA